MNDKIIQLKTVATSFEDLADLNKNSAWPGFSDAMVDKVYKLTKHLNIRQWDNFIGRVERACKYQPSYSELHTMLQELDYIKIPTSEAEQARETEFKKISRREKADIVGKKFPNLAKKIIERSRFMKGDKK
jgi:hypothetical protein